MSGCSASILISQVLPDRPGLVTMMGCMEGVKAEVSCCVPRISAISSSRPSWKTTLTPTVKAGARPTVPIAFQNPTCDELPYTLATSGREKVSSQRATTLCSWTNSTWLRAPCLRPSR